MPRITNITISSIGIREGAFIPWPSNGEWETSVCSWFMSSKINTSFFFCWIFTERRKHQFCRELSIFLPVRGISQESTAFLWLVTPRKSEHNKSMIKCAHLSHHVGQHIMDRTRDFRWAVTNSDPLWLSTAWGRGTCYQHICKQAGSCSPQSLASEKQSLQKAQDTPLTNTVLVAAAVVCCAAGESFLLKEIGKWKHPAPSKTNTHLPKQ